MKILYTSLSIYSCYMWIWCVLGNQVTSATTLPFLLKTCIKEVVAIFPTAYPDYKLCVRHCLLAILSCTTSRSSVHCRPDHSSHSLWSRFPQQCRPSSGQLDTFTLEFFAEVCLLAFWVHAQVICDFSIKAGRVVELLTRSYFWFLSLLKILTLTLPVVRHPDSVVFGVWRYIIYTYNFVLMLNSALLCMIRYNRRPKSRRHLCDFGSLV